MNIITIDGPSSSGKGSVAKYIAKKLQFKYLDSGAIYRAIALLSHDKHLTLTELYEHIINIKLIFNNERVYLNEVDITDRIREESIGMIASKIAQDLTIRQYLLPLQRNFAIEDNLIADGRDMGSVIFPYAQLKVFLTADISIRAERRIKQLYVSNNKYVTMDTVLYDLLYRDQQDSTRDISPLYHDETYRVLDNTNLSIEQSGDLIIQWYNNQLV